MLDDDKQINSGKRAHAEEGLAHEPVIMKASRPDEANKQDNANQEL